MPDNKRGLLIKKQEQVINHLGYVFEDLNYMFDTYFPGYPSHYEPVKMAITAVAQLVEMLRQLREIM